jgi:hypothetical protein
MSRGRLGTTLVRILVFVLVIVGRCTAAHGRTHSGEFVIVRSTLVGAQQVRVKIKMIVE